MDSMDQFYLKTGNQNANVIKRADELEYKVLENPQLYDASVELISALRKLDDLDRLTVARNRMAEQFPLAPNLWLDW